MDKVQWSRMAMLSGRKMRTKSGNLLSCVKDFLMLDEAQRHSAKIVVPECVQLDRGASIRVLSGQALMALAEMVPTPRRSVLQ